MSVREVQPRLSREEIAKREIGRTDVTPPLAWSMSVCFLLTLVIPPAVQCALELRADRTGAAPSAVALFETFPTVSDAFSQAGGTVWSRMLSANRRLLQNIEHYEQRLQDRSWFAQRALPPVQLVLTERAGVGNEQAYVGRNGWLFYRPDVDSLTGPGFLDPSFLKRRETGDVRHAPQPDPRSAIVEFHEQLARRGIRLILMPVPAKASICPEQLSGRTQRRSEVLANPSFERFKREMAETGVLVFDPAIAMLAQNETERQFLRSDTHWTAAAVDSVARELKRFIERECPLSNREPIAFRERPRDVENLGDVAAMLRLPENQTLFPREKQTIRQVEQPDGRKWMADQSADIFLLGDSFTNIYSLPEMGWGTSSGLAERLSFALGRPVDCLAQNDGGSHATRQTLSQLLARGHDRLAGKQVVVWEFAARELSVGDWIRIPMPESGEKTALPAEGEFLIRATVRSTAGAPQPGSVPYRDALTSLHLVDVEARRGSLAASEVVVYSWGMQDNRRTNAARWTPGQKLTLRLVPWSRAQEKYGRYHRIELDDPDFALMELPTFWAEEIP